MSNHTQPTPTDALTPLMGAENPNPDNLQTTAIDPALEKRMAEAEQANQALQKQVQALLANQNAAALSRPLTADEVGEPYEGPTETLIHPHLGTEVSVKAALVDSAIEQGFKRPPAKKTK